MPAKKKPKEPLQLEMAFQQDKSSSVLLGKMVVLMTPPIDEGYWLFRVKLSKKQAMVGFPKFGTIGIGFIHEVDWNTNLPYGSSAEDIFDHIEVNKGKERISRDRCLEAIRMIQKAAEKYKDKENGLEENDASKG